MPPADAVREGGGDRALIIASAAIALAAVVARMHDVVAYPPLRDWDASGHAVNVIDLYELRLPNPRAWSGSHPPVYYGIGAFLWAVLPEAIPVHVILRLVSAGAWVGTAALVWRALRRFGSSTDAAVIATLLLGVPGILIASCMMTNDPLCALFTTATLVRLFEARHAVALPARHAVLTGVLAGLAAATKATGMAAVGVALLFYLWQARRSPWTALRNTALAGVVAVAVAAPHYLRLLLTLSGSAIWILGGRGGSLEKEVLSAVVLAAIPTRGQSPAAILHSALWGDPTSVYLPGRLGWASDALSLGGVVVAAVAVAGVVRLLLHRELAREAGVVLAFGLAYAAALAWPTIQGPHFMLTKTSYMLPLALPVAVALAAGLGWRRGGLGVAARALVLLAAAGGVAATWYGWWESPLPGPPRREWTLPADSPAGTVERYVAWRASDPIRAAQLLSPQAHLAHDLRLVRILGLQAPEEAGLSPEDRAGVELARARMAWLELYNLVRWVQPVATGLAVASVEVTEEGDRRAGVRALIAPRGAEAPAGGGIGRWPFPPFWQQVTLERWRGSWRIAEVRQDAVVNENAAQALVAYPTLAGLEHLRAIGWRPSWEGTIPAVIPPLP